MPKKYHPLTPDEVLKILKKRGFIHKSTAGSHSQYEGTIKGQIKKVTVDLAEKEFNDFLIKSMIRQSGLSREEFYCTTKATALKINKRSLKNFDWFVPFPKPKMKIFLQKNK